MMSFEENSSSCSSIPSHSHLHSHSTKEEIMNCFEIIDWNQNFPSCIIDSFISFVVSFGNERREDEEIKEMENEKKEENSNITAKFALIFQRNEKLLIRFIEHPSSKSLVNELLRQFMKKNLDNIDFKVFEIMSLLVLLQTNFIEPENCQELFKFQKRMIDLSLELLAVESSSFPLHISILCIFLKSCLKNNHLMEFLKVNSEY